MADVEISLGNCENISIQALAPSSFPITVPTIEIPITLYTPLWYAGDIATPPAMSVGLSTNVLTYSQRASVELANVPITLLSPGYRWIASAQSAVIYTCTLTGGEDGLDDLTLPMKSFQCRLRDGERSYTACVIPDVDTYIDGIEARTNGEIIIRKGVRLENGNETYEEFARSNFYSLRYDQGPKNESITIVGYKQKTNQAPTTREVENVMFRGLQENGERRYRAPIDPFLKPGDTAIIGDASIVVAQINYQISRHTEYMELTSG